MAIKATRSLTIQLLGKGTKVCLKSLKCLVRNKKESLLTPLDNVLNNSTLKRFLGAGALDTPCLELSLISTIS